MTAKSIEPEVFPWFDYSNYSFSLGIIARDKAYLSGHTASEYDPKQKRIVVHGGIAEQVKTAYSKIGAILKEAGLGYKDVTRVVEYIRPEGMAVYSEAARVRTELLEPHRPVVNLVPVKSLLRSTALIEIEVTADLSCNSGETGIANGSYESDGIVFLPTVEAVDQDGNIVGEGDVVAQTEFIFKKASSMLSGLGLKLGNIVKTLDYFTPEALQNYRETGRVRKEYFGPVYPCAAGIVMPRLIHPKALIQYDFIASRIDGVAVNPGWKRYEKLTYSPGIRVGKLLFLSGQGSLNPKTERIEFAGDVRAQAQYTYENIFKVIEAAGGNKGNLIKTIEYVTPSALKRYREVGALRSSIFDMPYPASTGVVCEMLLRPEMQIEIDPFAVLS